MAQSATTKLVNRAAREPLRALGLRSRGSREWLDDHGWWVVAVHFRWFGYEQGSRLTIYADFLWRTRDHLAVSVGGPAGMAAALTGDAGRARGWFGRVLDHPPRPELFANPDDDWLVRAQRDVERLCELLDDPDEFAAEARRRAWRKRELLRLPAEVDLPVR